MDINHLHKLSDNQLLTIEDRLKSEKESRLVVKKKKAKKALVGKYFSVLSLSLRTGISVTYQHVTGQDEFGNLSGLSFYADERADRYHVASRHLNKYGLEITRETYYLRTKEFAIKVINRLDSVVKLDPKRLKPYGPVPQEHLDFARKVEDQILALPVDNEDRKFYLEVLTNHKAGTRLTDEDHWNWCYAVETIVLSNLADRGRPISTHLYVENTDT